MLASRFPLAYIKEICWTAFFHLSNIIQTRSILSKSYAVWCEKWVHADVTFRLDYCKSPLIGCPKSSSHFTMYMPLLLVINFVPSFSHNLQVTSASKLYFYIAQFLVLPTFPVSFACSFLSSLSTHSNQLRQMAANAEPGSVEGFHF